MISLANLRVAPMIRATQQPLDIARVQALVASGTPYDPLAANGLYESGDNYFIGVGGVDLTNAPLSALGFPVWNGTGNSHAAGKYQIEPGTWNPPAKLLGVWDFSPESQDAIAAYLYNQQGFAPWEPYDAPLAAFINSVGGPAAFYQPGSLPIRLAAAL
jgi:hypothetical protein